MCMSKPKPPPTPQVQPTPVPPVIVAPMEADTATKSAGDEARRQARAASGRSDTVLTSGLGATGQAEIGGKKLLGG